MKRRTRWIVLGAGALLVAVATSLGASSLPRDTLWRVEQTCVLNRRTTGASFPCLDVNLDRGIVLLRAPFRQTHIVAMPTVRTSGVEAARLRVDDAPNYFQAAWDARSFIQDEIDRPLAWTDFGLAVNSRLTRSQDQLHIHVDCLKPSVKQALASQASRYPVGSWLADGFSYHGQSYWVRRIDAPSLEGVNLFRLADEIPALAADPGLAVLAVVGTSRPGSGDGFLILAGRSDPARGDYQSTSEHLLEHSCGRGR